MPTQRFTVFFQSPVADTHPPRNCRRPWLTAVFDATGQYFPCCASTTPSSGGSIFDTDETAVINAPAPHAMREGLLNPDKPLATICATCPLLDDSYL